MKYLLNIIRRRLSQLRGIQIDKYILFNAMKNWNRFPRVAGVVFIASTSFLVQHILYPSVDRNSVFYPIYVITYSFLIITTVLFSFLVYFLTRNHLRIHFIYLLYFHIFIIGLLFLNILNLYHGQDLSLYAFAVMSIPLILRTRIPHYSVLYITILVAFIICLAIWHPTRTNGLMITQIFLYTFVGFMTTLTIEYARRKTFHLEEELRRKNTILETISVKDPLTGVYNRRYMMDLLVHNILLSRKNSHPFCQGIVDIDHFKKINDTLGHLTGDDVLKEIAKIIKSTVRSTDLVFRFGGEEFIILFPETNLESANIVMQRIRTVIESHSFIGVPWRVTASGGFTLLSDKDSPDTLLQRSDELLYQAKKDGRNRIYSK
ncbi:MAG TPA: GGDEF domain-containing protein [Leptospiraceae bacterium]|nr:GGDEF domain-containing protein [Leptospiraceae bacterium]HMW03466.1 GGDEF domain-containing protein [Leptospiraceae bacterium]HMX31599.1 GGDEF domain-containing protein [Leptospiraceae bacterium]HMY29614.1 GGDEF domain-containing protein [Leptospiraceae bacterium]HMZ62896.1 GGDEF domain-containing protein [Leptospiraceae bacterium]